jgi:glutamate-ammonia-ligase adenylyltransferase
VQLLQVVRGGQFPELRTRPTLDALQRVAAAGLMPQATADALAAAPTSSCAGWSTASSTWTTSRPMCCPAATTTWPGLRTPWALPDCCAFPGELDTHRELVAQEFDKLLGGGECANAKGMRGGPKAARVPPPDLDELLAGLPAQLRERVAHWREHPRVLALRDDARSGWCACCSAPRKWLQRGPRQRGSGVRLPTGSSRCCAARAIWRCCWSAPRARAPAAPAGRAPNGRPATCCSTPA